MPMNRADYPPDWPAISRAIRERAGNRCEWPGCGVPNGKTVVWERHGWRIVEGMEIEAASLDGEKAVRIVLTCAHLDHDTTHNDPANLKMWCQRHHNRHDHRMRQAHAGETRRRKRQERGQLAMGLEA